jgi:23S rRNA (cytosine1962-C5)-methyltransferase
VEPAELLDRLSLALSARAELLATDPQRESAWRLFNGHLEGAPELSAEAYARTLVLHNHADPPATAAPLLTLAQSFYLERLPWLTCVLVKARHAHTPDGRRGAVIYGAKPDARLREAGVRYALDLGLNQGTSFYPDTRALRAWARANLSGKTVLNVFAYTGSLGVAARAGGAARVVHVDRNRAALNLAKESCTLNGFPIRRPDFLADDVFNVAGRLRRAGTTFDCVLLDPPLFAATPAGRVDLVGDYARLLNKVRPLVADGGWLVAVNNALFVSGADFMATLTALGADGYLTVEALLPAPPDCAGFPETSFSALPADPRPFNHATKIAVLRVRRK